MKKSLFVLMSISLTMFLINAYNIQWNKSLNSDENLIALIGMVASSCAFLLLLILKISIKISREKKIRN
tara:strand:+ start:217 stop:423 length:207 start_codon:yes stop_codon:yes gene_type:complete